MKRTNKINRMVAFLAAVILTVFGLCQAAFAADTNTTNYANIDPDRPVSLTIKLVKEDGETDTAKTASIRIYQAGEWDGNQGKYVLTDEFAASGVNLEGKTGEDILEEISALQTFIAENGLTPFAQGRTQNGQYTTPELSMGLYMVCSPTNAQAIANGDNTVITPFLTTLPLWVDKDNAMGEWRYAVEASPKHGRPSGNNGGGSNGGGGSGGSGGGGGGTTTITPEGPPTALIDDGGTPLDGLNPPSELIDDEDVPLADNPFLELIEDVLVPLGLLPKTGDGSISYAPLLALMAASGLLIFGLIWRKVRKAR